MSSADLALLRRWAQRRDAEAFSELVQRHAGMVFGTCRRVLHNDSDAEDISQECFVRLAESASEIHTSLPGWLHTLATRRSMNLLKREARRRARERRFAGAAPSTTEGRWDDVEAYVDEAIEALPDELRLPVVAHFLERRTHAAIADELDLPRRTVTYRISKGVEAIRSTLRDRGVTIAAAALTGMLTEKLAEAVPASLAASLGRLALAGATRPTPAWARRALLGGPALGVAVAAALAILVAVGGYWARSAQQEVSAPNHPSKAAALADTGPAPEQTEPAQAAQTAPANEIATDTTEPKDALPAEVGLVADEVESGLIEDPSQYCTVSGTVRDEADRPVPLARVFLVVSPYGLHDSDVALKADYLQRRRLYETATDGHGRYTVERIPYSGKALLAAFKEGSTSDRAPYFELQPGSAETGRDIELPRGRMLKGRVFDQDGSPVADGIVQAYYCWHAKDLTRSGGLAPTGPDGRFALGFELGTQWCQLRVSSETHGQEFFWDIDVRSRNVTLRLGEKGRLRGLVTWADGRPAEGVVVQATGEAPEPEVALKYSGIRSRFRHEGVVDPVGHYEIEGLQPGVAYLVAAVRPDAANRRRPSPLSPAGWTVERLVFGTGETKEWNYTIAGSVTIRGRVLTERTAQPVRGVNAVVVRPGETASVHCSPTDRNGAYEIQMAADGEAYRIYALPDACLWNGGKEFDEAFGRGFDATGDAKLEIDLRIFEPVVLPLRVLDHKGDPVQSIHIESYVVAPDGRRTGHGRPLQLDDQGRGAISFYQPVAELWTEVGKWRAGPATLVEATDHFAVEPGETLPEVTIILRASCGITGVLTDGEGNLLVNLEGDVTAVTEDGRKEGLSVRTDKHGRFEIKDGVPAGVVTFSAEAREFDATLTLGPFELVADTINDLGPVAVEFQASAEPE